MDGTQYADVHPNENRSISRRLRMGSLEVALDPAPEGSLIVRLMGREIRSRQAAELAYRLTDAALSCRGRLVVALEGVSSVSAEWREALTDLSRRCEVLGGQLVVRQLDASRRVASAIKAA